MDRGDGFTFVIKEHLAVLATHTTGWKRELNIVEWNGNQSKFDIRDWNPEHDKMSKGITLRQEEARTVADALNKYLTKVDENKEDRKE